MPARTYITYYSETADRVPTDEELEDILHSLPKRSSFLELTMVNVLLSLSDRNPQHHAIHEKVMEYLLSEEMLELIRTGFRTESADTRPVFFRQQLLALMKRVLISSPDEGAENAGPLPSDVRHRLGEAALMTAELLVSIDQNQRLASNLEHDDALDELLVQWLPGIEIANPPDVLFALVRNNDYLSRLESSLAGTVTSTGETISEYFLRMNGIALDRYARVLHCLSAYFCATDLGEFIENTAKLRIASDTIFSKMRLSESEVEAFFNLTALDIDSMITLFENPPVPGLRHQYDFTPFRKYPLIRRNENALACVDSCFLTEKLVPGLYHTIWNSLSPKDREQFSSSWGQVFHDYVSSLLRLVYPRLSHRFHDREHFQRVASEYEAFDGVITYGDCIVAMEYKGGYPTLSAKYSGEIRRFLEDFDMKFGRQRRAGIEQLARKLTLMFDADPRARRNIPDLDLRHVTTIFPVLIVQDLALRSRLVNWKARQVFTREIQGRSIDPRVTVRHLSIITVEELEVLLPYLDAGDFTFADVLCAYAAEYRAPYYQPHEGFQDVLSKFVNERGLKNRINEEFLRRYNRIVVSLRLMFNE